MEGENEGPLKGLRVLELASVLAGPYCAMVLADLGADVIKVEPPTGDATRGYGPPWINPDAPTTERSAVYFQSVNRNKRSIRLDLGTDQGREVVRLLIARSDVLVENFRPGGMDRLGLGEAALRELNPKLVQLSITGYGPDGPDSQKPGYDFVAQAVGGLMSITGFPDAQGGHPTKLGVAITDIVTGLMGTVGVLAALRSGVGQRIDVSLLEATLATLINQAHNAFATGDQPARLGNAHPNIVPYETFATSDTEIVVAIGSERQWPKLCNELELADLATDERFADNGARVRNREVLRPILAARFAEADSTHWLRRLDEAGIPCGPVNDVLGAFAQPQAVARGMRVEVEHPKLGSVPQIGLPYKLSATPASIRSAPPLLGEHSAEILGELGYSAADIETLRAEGVI
ncbi:MAG TPA: CaiB/BaiF CoA-transferase family protein [Candidatus Limnocylindria bacterium]|nr:CaiB/BaiF CoA-transferase family protein [Candidatus Limnocylindria bacterium]